jgi:DNA-binding response OmpR family regulator
MKKILVIEDDRDLNSTIIKFLKIKSFECDGVYDGEVALEMVYENHYDLLLLDGKLPSMHGFELAQEIRKFSTIPIIFLTSLSSEKDVENGFMYGGDDYMIKPFSLNELFLRINAVLRRVYKNEGIISITSDIYFNTEKLILVKDNKEVHLTSKEIRLLELFLQNPKKIFTRDEIFELLYDYNQEPSEASLRVFINSIRKIIGKEKIQTIKNIGYKYVG